MVIVKETWTEAPCVAHYVTVLQPYLRPSLAERHFEAMLVRVLNVVRTWKRMCCIVLCCVMLCCVELST